MNICILHYSFAPVIGGVETVIREHARRFAKDGHSVTVVCGEGFSDQAGVELVLLPELMREHPLVLEAQRELDNGRAGEAFRSLAAEIKARIVPILARADILFAHNVLTMPFNLALTSVLWQLAEERAPGGCRLVAWIHDVAALNPDYQIRHSVEFAPVVAQSPIRRQGPAYQIRHAVEFPWNLLYRACPGFEYVAVSEQRAEAFRSLTGVDTRAVVPNGVDPVAMLGLTPSVAAVCEEEDIFELDLTLFHPTRILKRKNIELGIRVSAALVAKGCRCRYLVTGAPDARARDGDSYFESLRQLAKELGAPVVFLADRFGVTERDMAGLYAVSDVLFYPSAQEGFGLPPLEAALFRLPIFCSDIEPLRSMWQGRANFFPVEITPSELADRLMAFAEGSAALRAQKLAVAKHSWRAIHSNYLQPMLASSLQPDHNGRPLLRKEGSESHRPKVITL